MRIEKISSIHKNEILAMLEVKFKEVCKNEPLLPSAFKEKNTLESYVNWMCLNPSGYVIYDQKMIAFIYNIYIDDMFYGRKGVYTPEWGHVFTTHRSSLMLLKKTYEDMANGGFSDHSISVVNNSDSQSFLFDNSYGSRCMDAHMSLEKNSLKEVQHPVRIATLEDLEILLPLVEAHHLELNASPSLLGLKHASARTLLNKWLQSSKTSIYVVLEDDIIVGMMKTVKGGSGGCDLASDPLTLGIETTQVYPKYRGKKMTDSLLNHVCNVGLKGGYKRLAVDYETHNPNAQYYWPKFFEPTIRSLVRNIGIHRDE